MSLPDEAYVAALAGLSGMGPARLRHLLARLDARSAWERVRAGLESPVSSTPEAVPLPLDGAGSSDRTELPARSAARDQVRRAWAQEASALDLPALWQRCRRAGIEVTWPGDGRWPVELEVGPQPAGVIFWRGDLATLAVPAVALIGTRRATPDGRSVAFELGRDLASAGIAVVSGLALGIDGAAHAGALESREATGRRRPPGAGGAAATVGVAAGGVDVVYPRRHAALWRRVVASGVVLSETAPGSPPAAWRFPARNRIIAALVRMVVVVESHDVGGSMITVDAALARGVEVCAVPGPVHSAASAGSNQLLRDGATPVRHAGDVLDGLGMVGRWPSPMRRPPVPSPTPAEHARPTAGSSPDPADRPGAVTGDARRVLEAVGWHPTSYSQVIERTGLSLGAAGRHLDHLESAGLLVRGSGRWSRAVP